MSAEGAQTVVDDAAEVTSATATPEISIQTVEQAAPAERAPAARAESAPAARAVDTAEVVRAEHPSGDVFFTGEAGNLSDSEAEEVARQQLLRSGLLRGQRVRVAD